MVAAIVDSISWSNQGRLSLVGYFRPSTTEQRWRGTPAPTYYASNWNYMVTYVCTLYLLVLTTGNFYKKTLNWQLNILFEMICVLYSLSCNQYNNNIALFISTKNRRKMLSQIPTYIIFVQDFLNKYL